MTEVLGHTCLLLVSFAAARAGVTQRSPSPRIQNSIVFLSFVSIVTLQLTWRIPAGATAGTGWYSKQLKYHS